MMQFGFSGSHRAQLVRDEVISSSNRDRAAVLVGMIRTNTAVIRRQYQTASGNMETICVQNPQFWQIIRHRYAYPREIVATLQALVDYLRQDSSLSYAAEQDGITEEGIEETIEQVLLNADRQRRRKRKGDFDA